MGDSERVVRTESTLLSPMIDVVFKMLLTRNSSGRLLRDLIHTVLRPREPFEDLQILNPGIDVETIAYKAVVLVVLAMTRAGEQVQIEIQVSSQRFFRERALYYAARLYSSQLTRGGCLIQSSRAIIP